MLPSPGNDRSISVLIDYSDILDQFYYNLSAFYVPDAYSSVMHLYELQPETLVTHALQLIDLVLMRCNEGAETITVTYQVLATSIITSEELNRVFSPEDRVVSFRAPIMDRATHLNHYCAGALSSAVTELINSMRHGEAQDPQIAAGDNRLDLTVIAEADVILWEALVNIVLRTTQAIVELGRRCGISETMMASYLIDKGEPTTFNDPRTFIITLKGP